MSELTGSDALTLVVALVAGIVVAVLTAPVGDSGAVFLLPVQLDLLRMPSPVMTPGWTALPGAALSA